MATYTTRSAERKRRLERALDRLVALYREHADVRGVFVFGSLGGGRVGPQSDLDVLVVRDTAIVGVERGTDLAIAADLGAGSSDGYRGRLLAPGGPAGDARPGRPEQSGGVDRMSGMIEALVIEAIVGSAGVLTLATIVVRPRARPVKAPSLARAVARLPGRHRRRVHKIVAIAREHDARHSDGSPDAFTSRETLARYLPETIEAYLAVPKALRAVRVDGARSADDEFVRQLRTLRAGLERVQAIDGRAAASRLAANGAFLDERFGPPGPPEPTTEFASLASEFARSALAAWMRRARLR